jgi:hypothetical protein
MGKKTLYALLTCFIGYLIAAVVMFLISLTQSGWSQIGSNNVTFMMDIVTLGLYGYTFWGGLGYLAVLVPWLGSSLALALALLLMRPARTAGRRWQLGGFSLALYYVVILLVLGLGKLILNWGNLEVHPGDFVYVLLIIWPIGGFVVGYISAAITDKIVKLPVAERP